MMLLSRRIRLKPCGPMTAPAMMSPSSCGILSLFSNRGVSRMIISMMRNFSTGSAIGRVMGGIVSNVDIGFLVLFFIV